jgi:hypothetical protein
MVFAVKDLFEIGLLPAPGPDPPARYLRSVQLLKQFPKTAFDPVMQQFPIFPTAVLRGRAFYVDYPLA